MTHPLINRLIQEHRLIEGLIDQVKTSNSQHEKKIILKKIYSMNELQHHLFEEKLLFQYASEKEKIREGGPYCVLYYDQHVSNPPLERIEIRLQKKISKRSHQINFYKNQSPVCIPIDEHRAGEAILKHLLVNFEHLSKNEVETYFNEYAFIQKQHFKKEEGCFFCMISHLLSAKELDEILALWPPLVDDDNVEVDALADEPN